MKLAIVGAGWAGLAAAVQAADLGCQVSVFEASHTLGGRARAVHSPRLNTRIDNGQHIMLGAYTDTFALMRRLGIDSRKALRRETLVLESTDGTFRLGVPRLPAPLHLAGALLTARGLFLRDKLALVRILRRLQRDAWHIAPGTTVAQWLEQHRQSARVRTLFWIPLCVAALNTPIQHACAQLFANVLRDSLGAAPNACDVVLSKVDLSELWPDHVENLRATHPKGRIAIRRGAPVRKLGMSAEPGSTAAPDQAFPGVLVNNEHFDAVIVATNAPSARRLLAQLPAPAGNEAACHTLLDKLDAFRYVPIATVTLQLERAWDTPGSMYMLHENRAARHFGQWLFNCRTFMANPETPLLQIVISDAGDALAVGETELVRSLEDQLTMQTRRLGPLPRIVNHELIAEKRATFAAVPGLSRPGVRSPWPGILLAGDWTDTGYPAVLEGAIRSGQTAAMALHKAADGA